MKKQAAAFVVGILALVFSSLSYCQSDIRDKEEKVIRGQISEIDWPASTITIKYLQTEGEVVFDEVTIFVPSECKIKRGTETLGLAELDIGNQVTVVYVDTSPGPLKAKSITVVL